jgi:hypothetical protein
MGSILKLKAGYLFLLFLLYFFVLAGVDSLLLKNIGGFLHEKIRFLLSTLFYTYPVLTSLELSKKLDSEEARRRFNHFKISGMILLAFVVVSLFIRDEVLIELPIGVRLILGIITFYFYFRIFLFPAWILKTLELKEPAGIWEYIADGFQFWCWPICVWWIQPRINKVDQTVLNIGE